MIQEKERERGSRYEMRLISSEMKDQLNWVPNPNNSQGERENEKKYERKEWKEVSGNVVPSVDANKDVIIFRIEVDFRSIGKLIDEHVCLATPISKDCNIDLI
jgi:hypothetical protein